MYLTEHKLRFKEVGASSSSSSSSSLSSRCEPSLRGYGLASSAAAAPSALLPSIVTVARVRDTLHASSFTAWGVMHIELGFQQHDAQCWDLPVLSRSNAVIVRIHRARCGMWLLLGETAPPVCIDLMRRRWLRPDGRVISTDGHCIFQSHEPNASLREAEAYSSLLLWFADNPALAALPIVHPEMYSHLFPAYPLMDPLVRNPACAHRCVSAFPLLRPRVQQGQLVFLSPKTDRARGQTVVLCTKSGTPSWWPTSGGTCI